MAKRRRQYVHPNQPQQQHGQQYGQPLPPHLQQVLNPDYQNPQTGNHHQGQPAPQFFFPQRDYAPDDTAQEITPTKPMNHLQKIRQGQRLSGLVTPAPLNRDTQALQAFTSRYQQSEDVDDSAEMQQLMAYLQQEKAARQHTNQMAQASFQKAMQAQQTKAPRNWYALMWIFTNAILSFVANLYFAHNVLRFHFAVSVVLAIFFAFVPSLVIRSGRAVWRWIRVPGRQLRDAFLGATWFSVLMASLAINWIATMSLLEHALIFERSLTLWAIYAGVAIFTDIPQLTYFLRRK